MKRSCTVWLVCTLALGCGHSEPVLFVTELHEAVKAQNVKKIQELLAQGADVNAKDTALGQPPLHFAVAQPWASKEIAELLLAQQADPNLGDDTSGNNALHIAVAQGSRELVELLLAHQANPNAKDKAGRMSLHYAVLSPQIAPLLVVHGADINAKDRAGQTPAEFAVSGRRLDALDILVALGADVSRGNVLDWVLVKAVSDQNFGKVKEFLAQGANPNAKLDIYNWPPLHIAITRRSKDISDLLLASGAYVDAKDNVQSATALHIAATAGATDITASLLARGANLNLRGNADHTPCQLALQRDSLDIVELLLIHGAQPPEQLIPGQPLLSAVISQGHTRMIALLVARGADLNTRGEHGETPLHLAMQSGKKDMVEFLLARGADVNTQGDIGGTPLHLAASFGHRDIAAVLIAHRAQVNVKGKSNGETPLHSAARRHPEVAEFLLTHGADIHAIEDCEGQTPLHIAAAAGNGDAVTVLLAHGADVNARAQGSQRNPPCERRVFASFNPSRPPVWARKGMTPLHLAALQGHSPVIEMLIAHGADINARDDKGQTPLTVARLGTRYQWGHTETVKLLLKYGAEE